MEERNSKNSMSQYHAYCCPTLLTELDYIEEKGFLAHSGEIYQFIDPDCRIVDFIGSATASQFDELNKKMYDSSISVDFYRQFLDWLFSTFNINETDFRLDLIKRLKLRPGHKLLITGCGFGDDIEIANELIGSTGEIHAQDLSKSMVLYASEKHNQSNVFFSVSSATDLPYKSRYFDAVFHFGGINLFGDIKKAISEMERVCKLNGHIVFGDEGIASHLRDTEYADIAICNNKLWASHAPIHLLPCNAENISLNYVLGNCFYIISFSPSTGFPAMNIDIPHKGIRGGTARTRYFGATEGLTTKTKELLTVTAKQRGVSVHALLEEVINKCL